MLNINRTPPRTRRSGLIAVLLIAAAIAAPPSRADVVTQWDEITMTTLLTAAPAERPNAIIDFGLVHIAMFDAINSIAPKYRTYVGRPITNPDGASPDAAAIAAAYRVLSANFPSRAAALLTSYQNALAAIADGPAKTLGVSVGTEVANAVLVWRTNDGRFTPVLPYVPGVGPGTYQFTPPAFGQPVNQYIPFVKPLAVRSLAQFRADGPADLTSETYAADYDETKRLGYQFSTERTAAQTEIALFHTENPTTFWSRNLRNVGAAQNLPLLEHARLMALLFVAQGDALMTCFDSKYHFNFWRPVTAIPAGDTDGNALTVADPAWTPRANTPPHPEYPAAHGCAAGAVAEVVRRTLGPNTAMSFNSTVANTIAHNYARPGDLVDEIVVARIYGGMHFRKSGVDGAKLGRNVAKYVLARYFKPLDDDHDDDSDHDRDGRHRSHDD